MANKTLKPSDFDSLSAPMQAAWRWVDAMAAAGKAPAAHPESVDELGWSWAEFGQAVATYRDMDPHPRSEEAVALLEEWFEQGQADEAAGGLMRSKMSWCFMDYGWEPEDQIFVCLWPTDAPALEIEALSMPAPGGAWEAQEGVWGLSGGFSEESEALQDAWDELTAWGFSFDERIQRDPSGTAYAYANESPEEMWLKAQASIDALKAHKESSEIEGSANKGKTSASPRGI